MRVLGRFGVRFRDFARRRRSAWTGRARRVRICGTSLVEDAIDPPPHVVRHIERAIRTDGDSGGTICGAVRSLYRASEAVSEDLATARCVAVCEGLKDHVVSALRVGRPVPRTVKGDEHAVMIAGRKLFL